MTMPQDSGVKVSDWLTLRVSRRAEPALHQPRYDLRDKPRRIRGLPFASPIMAAVMVWTALPRRHHNAKDVAACAKTGKAGVAAFCEALSRPGMRFVPVKSAN